MKSLLNQQQIDITIKRLATHIIENDVEMNNTVLIGIQPRGVYFSNRIASEMRRTNALSTISYGILDITFYRDDVRNELHLPNQTNIPFSIEAKRVILIDDVLYTGRTIRAAIDALLSFGRPKKVELLVLVNRRYSRELPIQPDYTGISIDSIVTQKVKVLWREKDGYDEVVLID